MKIYASFLHSKVGRRILLLFICCALLPIGALSFLSFTQVVSQLNKQCQMRLHQATKAMGMGIFERLIFLEAEMKLVASYLTGGADNTTKTPDYVFNERLEERIKAMSLFTETHGAISIFGHNENPPKLTSVAMQQLKSAETSIFVTNSSGLPSRIFLVMPVDPQNTKVGILIGEINNDYLWGIGPINTLPPMTELCVLDQSKNILISSVPLPLSFQKQIAFAANGSTSRQFEWKNKDTTYLASSWDIFLKSKFSAPMWTIALSQSKADIREPIANFKKIFPLVVFMSIWVVLFLSSISIRKSLVPLEKLKEGTRRVAAKEFSSRVKIVSGDEFEELGDSFNAMSIQLGRQFNALETMSAVSQTILSSLNIDKITETILTGIHNIFQCDAVSVSIINSHDAYRGSTYVANSNSEVRRNEESFVLSPRDIQEFDDNPEYFLINKDNDIPRYLSPIGRHGIKSFLILPIFIKEKLSGFIAIGYINPQSNSEEDNVQGRQLADQVAVALSNALLLEELYQLNWGTLTALARTVDAKSPWTAGHSERVKNLALKVGKVLDFGPKELETLKRGALLHDVGKIGIPASILNKTGKLTEEEYSVIKKHPTVGARILEPIKAYSEAIPLVAQHHERFDGKGYPEGLAGEDISLGGRILAVCDVFDAMVSNRPYRPGGELERVIEVIRQETGKLFDPKVVEAFFEAISEKKEVAHESRISISKPHRNYDKIEKELPVDQSIIESCV